MALATEEIYDKFTEIFRDTFDDDEIVVSPDLTASMVDGWDSLTHIRLLLRIEKAFKVKFSAAEIGKLTNVGELATLVESKLPNR